MGRLTPELYINDFGPDPTSEDWNKRTNYYTRTCKLVINYFANGATGNPPSSSTKTHSGTAEAITLSDVVKDKGSSMTRSGYNFIGWSTSSNSSTVSYNPGDVISKSWAENASGTQTYNLYAVWTTSPIIIYKPDENSAEYSDTYHDKYQEAPLNQQIQLRNATYTRKGYTQTGWKTSSGSTTFTVGQAYTRTSNSNLTLYPIWTANVYNVTIKPNGASGSDIRYSVTYDTNFTIEQSPFARTGYHILSFNEAKDGSASDWYMGSEYQFTRTSDVTLYTIWEGNEYFVVYDDGSIKLTNSNVTGLIYTNLSIDSDNCIYSSTNDLHKDQDNLLYVNYPATMRFVADGALSGNYSIATYGQPFYTDYRPKAKEGYSFIGWEAEDGTVLTKQDAWLDAYSFGKNPIWTKLNDVVLKPIWSGDYPYGRLFFGRKESSDFGIIIEHPPKYSWPQLSFTHKSINGKNGDALSNPNRYENAESKYEIAVYNKKGFYDASAKASEFLHRYNTEEYVRLENTYEPDVYMMAIYEEAAELENLLSEAGRGTITFNCKPQKFLISGNRRIEVLDSPFTITNPTSYASTPIIKIRGTGTITFKGKPHYVFSGSSAATKSVTLEVTKNYNEITLDCDTFNAVDVNGKNSNELITYYDAIKLYPGPNTITYDGYVERIYIIPRWWRQ